jgi:hypothetical protein
MQCGSDGQLYMEKEELELENKPEGVGKEKQAPEQNMRNLRPRKGENGGKTVGPE